MDYRKAFLESILVVDVETTSSDKSNCEIIEFGSAVRNKDNTGWDSQSILFKPLDPIPPESSAVNGISNRMVEDKNNFVSTAPSDIFGLTESYELRVAHNVAFDKEVLSSHGFVYENWLCTLQLSKKLFSFIGDKSITRFDLPYLKYALDLDCDHLVSHRADSDCEVTGELFVTMLDIMESIDIIDPSESYLDQIVNFMQTPVILDTVPFGKHRGKKFEEVPADYWMWAINNMDVLDENNENFDSDLAESISRSLGN